jgi:hypothetical protein
MFDGTFQHATVQHRLMAMGIVVAAVLVLGALGKRIGARRRPTPQRPAAQYYPPAPAPVQRSRSRSGRR